MSESASKQDPARAEKRDDSILVVDDAESNRLILRSILESEGYRVTEARHGAACIELCRATQPRLVLLDIMMPEMDGREVLRRLRRTYRREELPIIIVSTLADGADVALGLKEGANDYIPKPIDRAVLVARVKNQCDLQDSLQRNNALERKLHEASRLRTVGVFASGIAHNFNNLFGGMLGAAELLDRLTQGDDRARRCLVVLRKGIEGGMRLTKRMTVFAGAEGVLESSESERADVVALLANLVEVQRALEGERIEFVLTCVSPHCLVAMKESHLTEIFMGLISNSIDAIPEKGRIAIRIEVTQERRVQIQVADTGLGMSAEVRMRVFEPFFSTKNLDTVNGLSIEGNGLGMWNVHNLVHHAGGTIDLQSEVGKGTTVMIELPTVKE